MNELIDNRYTVKNIPIGEGAWSVVYYALDTQTNELLACKKARQTEEADQEVKVLERSSRLDSEYLVNMRHYFKGVRSTYIFLELMESTLEDELDKRGCFSESEALYHFHRLVLGLNDLHQAQIIHRDIKPGNLFFKGSELKIGDFNFSSLTAMRSSTLGTPEYISPKMIEITDPGNDQLNYGPEVDFWSAALILYKMLFGKLPYDQIDIGKKKILVAMRDAIDNYTGENLKFPQPNNVTSETKKLLKRMLNAKDPRKWNAGMVLNSECFKRFAATKSRMDASLLQRKEQKQGGVASSVFISNIIDTTCKSALSTKDLDLIILLERLDLIMINETNKLVFLDRIMANIEELGEHLRKIKKGNPSLYEKLREFHTNAYKMIVLLRTESYFSVREISHLTSSFKGMNELIQRNKKILRGDIDMKQWKDINVFGSDQIKQWKKDMNTISQTSKNKINQEYRVFKASFGKMETQRLKKIYDFIDKRTDKKKMEAYQAYFKKEILVFMKQLIDAIDILEDTTWSIKIKDIVAYLYYYGEWKVSDVAKGILDWEKNQMKLDGMDQEHRAKIMMKIRHRYNQQANDPTKFLLKNLPVVVVLLLAIIAFFVFKA